KKVVLSDAETRSRRALVLLRKSAEQFDEFVDFTAGLHGAMTLPPPIGSQFYRLPCAANRKGSSWPPIGPPGASQLSGGRVPRCSNSRPALHSARCGTAPRTFFKNLSELA